MDFFGKPLFPELSDVVHCTQVVPERQEIQTNHASVDDGISSLMQMAESMEALLPPDISNDIFPSDISHTVETSSLNMLPINAAVLPSALPNHERNRISTISENEMNVEPMIASQLLSDHLASAQSSEGFQILSFLSRETSCEEISNDVSYATPDIPSSPTEIHPFHANYSTSSTNNSSGGPIPVEFSSLVNYNHSSFPVCSDRLSIHAPEIVVSSGHPSYSNPPLLSHSNICDGIFTPVSAESPGHNTRVRSHLHKDTELDTINSLHEFETTPTYTQQSSLTHHKNKSTEELGRITKSRKTARKPKTYSKPVASRFCHICSRMPRRGQGSATCKRIAEGLCRKIVCEQCIREQGWDYDAIKADKNGWLCPHCAEVCPARSQCHIYNRINARRKRTSGMRNTSAVNCSSTRAGINEKAILSSGSSLRFSMTSNIGQYADNFQSQNVQQILQPPPNFRLNLPMSYTQM